MDENGDIRASLADALAKVEILQSANHIGLPFERQMEAKLYLLRHQIAEYQSILECSNLPRREKSGSISGKSSAVVVGLQSLATAVFGCMGSFWPFLFCDCFVG
jgi:hypothetical protein